MAYLLTKTAHLVFVMAWMGGVFYLPRILVNLAEAGNGQASEEQAVRARLVLMGRRLYRFGHVMFGLAFAAVLCLIVTPVFYAIFFNVHDGTAPPPESKGLPRPEDDAGPAPDSAVNDRDGG